MKSTIGCVIEAMTHCLLMERLKTTGRTDQTDSVLTKNARRRFAPITFSRCCRQEPEVNHLLCRHLLTNAINSTSGTLSKTLYSPRRGTIMNYYVITKKKCMNIKHIRGRIPFRVCSGNSPNWIVRKQSWCERLWPLQRLWENTVPLVD